MTKIHGNKIHYQILLDPHRAALLEKLAAGKGVRTTALVRDMVYRALQRGTDGAAYGLAAAKDQALHRQGIQNQVQGRVKTQG